MQTSIKFWCFQDWFLNPLKLQVLVFWDWVPYPLRQQSVLKLPEPVLLLQCSDFLSSLASNISKLNPHVLSFASKSSFPSPAPNLVYFFGFCSSNIACCCWMQMMRKMVMMLVMTIKMMKMLMTMMKIQMMKVKFACHTYVNLTSFAFVIASFCHKLVNGRWKWW